jgi:hypothetical protein
MFYDVKDFSNSKIFLSLYKIEVKVLTEPLFYIKLQYTWFHQAVLMGEFKTCDNDNHCAITAATIAPDDSKVAILTHDRIFLFENFEGDNFFEWNKNYFRIKSFFPKEASFIDNDRLLLPMKTKSVGGTFMKLVSKN